MRMQYKPIIIFSVDRTTSSGFENAMNRRIAERDMAMMGIQFERVLGAYEGAEEWSYIVDGKHAELIRGIAKHYNQDSILLRDNENQCNLQYFDGRPLQFIGELKQVSQEIALASGCYTYNRRLDQYFMAVR